MSLKPSEEFQISAIVAALVYGIYQLNAPNLADVRASRAGTGDAAHVHGSVKEAAWTAAVVVAGLAILAKSPTIFVVGGVVNTAEAWKYYHANVTNPSTGKVDAGVAQQGS